MNNKPDAVVVDFENKRI